MRGDSRARRGAVNSTTPTIATLGSAFIREMRPHQWVKNLLVFVPVLAAHQYLDQPVLPKAILAFVLFSLCASGVYFLNDLVDREADRKHPKKRFRPLASGDLPVSWGIAGAIVLPLLAFMVALVWMPLAFVAVLAIYFVATTAYSFYLKKTSTADVITLAALYTIRILAGGAATGIVLSTWLLALSMFLFLSLAYLKRYIELAALDSDAKAVGRGYTAADRESMFSLGVANATASVMILAMYISSDDVRVLYRNPELLWFVCLLLLYWNNRIWIGARRGKVHDDPVLFAIKDPVSRLVGVALVGVILAARHLPLG